MIHALIAVALIGGLVWLLAKFVVVIFRAYAAHEAASRPRRKSPRSLML